MEAKFVCVAAAAVAAVVAVTIFTMKSGQNTHYTQTHSSYAAIQNVIHHLR